MAEALRRHHAVEIVHHASFFDVDALGVWTGTCLDGVTARRVEPRTIRDESTPWARYEAEHARDAELSGDCDLFIAFTYFLPPFCHAPRGAMRLLFPFVERPRLWPPPADWGGSLLTWWPRGLYHAGTWARRVAGYQVKTANSVFVARWGRRRWGINCAVVYPPVAPLASSPVKRNLILSVGRFARVGNSKKQLEMVEAFRAMTEAGFLPGWEYVSAGGLGERAEDRAYFEAVRRAAEGTRARVIANADPLLLRQLYAEAKIFWHAAGLGEDEERHPERLEHFGIVTVEAMSAGCVPVVIDQGGPREVVEPGVNGLLWADLDELILNTRYLAGDEIQRAQMAAAGRTRAFSFTRATYIAGMLTNLDIRSDM